MGYTSGLCLKKASKVIGILIGGFYLSLQALAYDGYVNLNVDKIEKDFNKIWDINNDGKVDLGDAKIFYEKVYIHRNRLLLCNYDYCVLYVTVLPTD